MRAAVAAVGFLSMVGCAQETQHPLAPSANSGLLSTLGGVVGGTLGLVTNTVEGLLSVPVVTRNTALAQDVTVTQTIGKNGGAISIPSANLTVTFAPGAVDSATSITVTAYKGKELAFGFGPHGLVFKAPVTFKVGLANTSVAGRPDLVSTLKGGYIPNGLLDLDGLGNALVSELNAVTAILSPTGKTVDSASFNIPHFSGYILAGGRKKTTD
jgi:hypothetical protein